MASPFNPKDLVTLEELTISNMWEVAALIEVLEKKGVVAEGEVLIAESENFSVPQPTVGDDARAVARSIWNKT